MDVNYIRKWESKSGCLDGGENSPERGLERNIDKILYPTPQKLRPQIFYKYVYLSTLVSFGLVFLDLKSYLKVKSENTSF
jgi:hypothetical protein